MLKNIIIFCKWFCNICWIWVDELLGKPHNMVRHKRYAKAAFKSYGYCSKRRSLDRYVKMQQKMVDIIGFL